MSLQIVQNQQLKPIGDKVAIDTQLSTTSENAISNKAVTEKFDSIVNYDEVIASYIDFNDFDIDLTQYSTGDKIHIIVQDPINRIFYIKDLIVGVDARTNLTFPHTIIIGGYYLNANYTGACSLTNTNTGHLTKNTVTTNGSAISSAKITAYLYKAHM